MKSLFRYQWKKTFGGRQLSVEDNLHSVEDDIWWKTTLTGRRPSVENDLCWKTTYCGRLPAVEDELQWKTTFVGSLHVAYSALRHFCTLLDYFYSNFIIFLLYLRQIVTGIT